VYFVVYVLAELGWRAGVPAMATGRTAGGCQEKTIDSLAILANSVLYILYIRAIVRVRVYT